MANRRAALRAQALHAIKTAALEHLRRDGASGLSLRAVARDAGMSAPGLYRYFDSRDALLTALITDGFDALADHLLVATGAEVGRGNRRRPDPPLIAAADDDVAERLRAAALAYRDWAVRHPNEFGLLFGDPIPGYAAPAGGPTVAAMRRVGTAFGRPLVEAWQAGRLAPLAAADLGEALGALSGMSEVSEGIEIPPEVGGTFLTAWGRLHGNTCLEVFGHHHWLFPDGAEPLYRAEIERMLVDLGIVAERR